MLTPAPVRRGRASSTSWSQQPDWLNLGPSYAHALAATYTWLGGLLRQRADRDFVMILIGDHQPPALVSGEGASWDVPVHVIASRATRPAGARRAARARLPERADPAPPEAISKMHELMPILLDAFSGADRGRSGPLDPHVT